MAGLTNVVEHLTCFHNLSDTLAHCPPPSSEFGMVASCCCHFSPRVNHGVLCAFPSPTLLCDFENHPSRYALAPLSPFTKWVHGPCRRDRFTRLVIESLCCLLVYTRTGQKTR